MNPFGDFIFFGILLYAVVPTLLLGLLGKAGRWWTLLVVAVMLCVQFGDEPLIPITPGFKVREVWIVLGYGLFQGILAFAFLRWRSRWTFYAALALSILPLAVHKALPIVAPDSVFGFLGISYVTFRALDVIFSIHDGVLKSISPIQYFAFLFFFPCVSSGPIDRYRRFEKDWLKSRNRTEFLDDLDVALSRVFQGFLYKFIIAALLYEKWVEPAARMPGFLGTLNQMYAETLYLFFDFAGYSAFAIGFGRLFGIRVPENFDAPFLSRNIRDFWNRWHISLSFWFRDHIYMRFLLAATKGKWFTGKHTATYLGLILTFGLMGLWHGPQLHYILYGFYHAALLCGYDWFARWNKTARAWPDGRAWRALNVVLTFHAFAFGIVIFNGHLTPRPPPPHEDTMEKADCHEVTGFVWDPARKSAVPLVDIYVDYTWIARVPANEFREDLRERGMSDGRHGFRYEFPSYVRDGRSHTIEVRLVGPNRYLRNIPSAIAPCDQEEIAPVPAPPPVQ